MSREERAAINRTNARKSTGPKTDEGKARSSRNALKHGLRIERIALPERDAQRTAELTLAWTEYYKPVTSEERALVDACVTAVVLWERCERFYQESASRRTIAAIADWQREQDEEVAALVRLLDVDPTTALSSLGRSSAGCRYLLGRWQLLHDALEKTGRWDPSQDQEAKRLGGLPAHVRLDPTKLRPVVKGCLAMLAEQAERLETTLEAELRAERVKVAAILLDAPARLYLRTVRQARSQFDRNYRHLLQVLENRLALKEASSATEAKGAIEANARAEASFPNEAKATTEAKGANKAIFPSEATFPIEPNGSLGARGQAQRAPGEVAQDPGLEVRPEAPVTNEAKAPTEANGAIEANRGSDRGLEARPQPPSTNEAKAAPDADGANEATATKETRGAIEANGPARPTPMGWARRRTAARWWLRR